MHKLYKLPQNVCSLMVKKRKSSKKSYESKAHELAEEQKEISVSQFFEKNRHLLGFDNPTKALSTTVKELVDNSLDATQDMETLPEIIVIVKQTGENKYSVSVEDNGPGIIKEQIPKVFAKLLYGSKFAKMKQSLTGDEPIIIRENGKIKIMNIEELIDPHIRREGVYSPKRVEVPCFNWRDYTYNFKPVNHFIKHKRENEIYKIKTLYGKYIKVTGCHSLFTIDNETLELKEIEAKNLKEKDIVVAPGILPIKGTRSEINILDYIDKEDAKKHYWYIYTAKKKIKEIFSRAEIVRYKKKEKHRKYYRLKTETGTIDVVDESYRQYLRKGFIPVWIAKSLKIDINDGVIKTYYHGKEYVLPLEWSLTEDFMKFIGLYVAEGHLDKRHVGLTFGRHERDLVRFVCKVALDIGVNFSVEERPEKNSVRVNLFGGVLSYLLQKWCGHGAKQKRIPDFVFTAVEDLRQHCMDYLYVGDGHNTQGRNQLMLSTTSKTLANQVIYLWLSRGVIASSSEKMQKGLGRFYSKSYVISVYGDSIRKSHYFTPQNKSKRKKRRAHDLNTRLLLKMIGERHTENKLKHVSKIKGIKQNCTREDFQNIFGVKKIGYTLRSLLDNQNLVKTRDGKYAVTQQTIQLSKKMEKVEKLIKSDLIFLPIKKIEKINKENKFVYDISVRFLSFWESKLIRHVVKLFHLLLGIFLVNLSKV